MFLKYRPHDHARPQSCAFTLPKAGSDGGSSDSDAVVSSSVKTFGLDQSGQGANRALGRMIKVKALTKLAPATVSRIRLCKLDDCAVVRKLRGKCRRRDDG